MADGRGCRARQGLGSGLGLGLGLGLGFRVRCACRCTSRCTIVRAVLGRASCHAPAERYVVAGRDALRLAAPVLRDDELYLVGWLGLRLGSGLGSGLGAGQG